MAGWIADHRKEIESDVWLMPPMYHRVWQWLKYKVNHRPNKIPNKDGTFTTIMPGQHATSYRLIAKGVGYYEGLKWKEPNAKTVKSILDWMVSQNMITVQGNTMGTIVTIEKWAQYQEKKNEGNTKETRRKHDLDTNNNDKTIINNKDEDRAAPSNVPYEEIKELYNGICKSFPKVIKVSENRKKAIRARWNEYKQDITVFENLFSKAEASDFMKGKNDKNWQPDFDWMMNQANMVKVLEGKYDKLKQTSGRKVATEW